MKVVKHYPRGLNHTQYDYNDYKELVKKFNIKPLIAEKLCTYMEHNHKVIDVKELYEPRSGWTGFDFFIDRENLSINGFNFSNDNIVKFLQKRGF
jgi:hypothetical protein